MLIVDHRDLESLSDRDAEKLLLWAASEILRRHGADEGFYRIQDQVSEAALITGARYAVIIEELES